MTNANVNEPEIMQLLQWFCDLEWSMNDKNIISQSFLLVM